MRISDPVLVPDVSNWVDHINPKEFEDAGCGSVVVGLYPYTQNGKQVLNAISRKQCVDIATKSSMVLQGYFWDDIIIDPLKQADWLADTLVMEGLPIKWVWTDQEQWWSDWNKWYLARQGKIYWDEVPRASPVNISAHNAAFNKRFHERFHNHGVYTNKGFVSSWAAPMDAWLPAYKAWVPHYGHQPNPAVQMTWQQLKDHWCPTYNIILSSGQIPEEVVGHQFTGDACILPGSYTFFGKQLPLDVSVFSQGFIDHLRSGTPIPQIPAPQPLPTPQYAEYSVLYPRINVRATPGGTWLRYAVLGEVVKVVLPIERQNGYIKITDGWVWETYIIAK